VLKDTGRMVGTIGFTAWHPHRGCLEVGYSLARACWGQGYAAEALRLVLDQCFRVMRVHRVEAYHDVDNPASGRVMEKCGMRKEGVLRRQILNKGEWRDVCLWAVVEGDPLTGS
jgi:ribosomal-protein-alanine N-acetyltransferase